MTDSEKLIKLKELLLSEDRDFAQNILQKLDSLEDSRYFTIPRSEKKLLEQQQRNKILLEAAIKRLDRLETKMKYEIEEIQNYITEANLFLQKVVPFSERTDSTKPAPAYFCDGLPSRPSFRRSVCNYY